MKEKFLFLFFAVTVLFFVSCDNVKQEKKQIVSKKMEVEFDPSRYDENNPEYYEYKSFTFEKDEEQNVSYDSVQSFFTLDYTPEYPDNIFNAKNRTNVSGSEKNVSSVSETSKTESVIPGIRKLSEYKTKYSSEKAKPAEYEIEETDAEMEEDVSKVFEVVQWGPQGKIVASENNPSFYVIFSVPVRPLKALSDVQKTSDVISIEPELPGVFKWYGSKHISFEAETSADPTVVYTIRVNPELVSVSGKKISGNLEFKTQAEQLKVINIWGGYIEENKCAYSEESGALPPYENRFIIRTNYSTRSQTISDSLTVFTDKAEYKFTVTPVFKKVFYMWTNQPEFDETKKITNTFFIEVKGELPKNTFVKAGFEGTDSKNYKSYSTLKNFRITSCSEATSYSHGKYAWPLSIDFSTQPDKKSLIENISFDFNYKLTEENIKIYGNSGNISIYNLPLEYGKNYKIKFGSGLKDIYGQSISFERSFWDYKSRSMKSEIKSEYEFRTPGEQSYVNFQNWGSVMLEAQFPHIMLFEYQNILEGSYYTISATQNPMKMDYKFDKTKSEKIIINSTEKNMRQFEQVELNPFLKNDRYGFVKFFGHVNYTSYNWWTNKAEDSYQENRVTVQVTDLGITSRIAFNKAVVLVRSLETGKPVENAEVFIVSDMKNGNNSKANSVSFEYDNKNTYRTNLIANALTDKDGLCVINFDAEQMKKIDGRVCVYVVNGEDQAVYCPKSHDTWRYGVYNSSAETARKTYQRTFMFCDRGIYRPGEIVTFRGIDRDQLLGALMPYKGDYTLISQGDWWNSENIIKPIEGTTSSSGGFYGSFKLPDKLQSGSYVIKYKRSNSNSDASITFTVANFERVKFESSIKIPDVAYTGGDKLSATLSANYLAGGSLAGASYEVTWFNQPSVFRPETPDAKAYSFYAPSDSERKNYSEDRGKLSNNGSASVSCKSEKITDGVPYVYHIESVVTDVSNQRISAQNNIFVNPASFYIGLKQAQNINGFARKGTKLVIPFILTNHSGFKLSENEINQKLKSLDYKLTREEWTMIHEQSVDDTIYTRYERTDVLDSEGKISVQNAKTFTVTPKESGWYTLTVTGCDSKGNKVISQISFYVTGGQSSWYDRYNSQSINLTPNQAQYNPGETAKVLFESPLPAGDYLITVEREGIFTEEVRHFDSSADVIEIPVANNYVPVVYLSISSYSLRHGKPTHNYGEVDLDKPKGYYGVAPIFVNPLVRSFTVQIECDKPSYKPGEQATFTFKATKGGLPYSGAELTAMAVDRGVLDLINYHVPNPVSFFYDQYNFPLRVFGGDSRALLMDPVTYSIKNLIGGDAEETKEEERKDFRPTAFFEPVLITDENGEAKVTFTMPDSLTTYRITCFGVKDDLFALEENEIKVQNPVNVQQVQPRMLRERDTAECGVLISNLSDKNLKVKVSLSVETPEQDTEQDKLEGRKTIPGTGFVDGKTEHTVAVASGQSTVVYFDVCAQKAGTVNLVYSINSEVLNEKLVSPIKIEKSFVYETVTLTGQTTDEKQAKENELLVIPGFAKEGRGDLKITIDATRLGALGSSVNYLFDYPYGCLEQQSSRILPLVAFGEYIDVFGLDRKVIDVKKTVKSYTKKWKNYQKLSGGFGYWPDSSFFDASFYVSLRIAHIYALALQNGYSQSDIPINDSLLKSYLIRELKKTKAENEKYNQKLYENQTPYNNNYNEAYCCFVFSLLNDHSLDSTLNDLYAKADELTLDEIAFVSLAYANSGNIGKAKELTDKIRPYLQLSSRSVSISPKEKSGYWYWYRNETSVLASVLQAFVTVNPADLTVDHLVYALLTKQSKGRWQNTITTAQVLESIHAYIKNRNLDDTDYAAAVTLQQKEILKAKLKGAGVKPKVLELPFENEFIQSLPRDKSVPLVFEKSGDGYLFYTVEMKYAIPDEMQYLRNEGLSVTYTIYDSDTGNVMNADSKTNVVELDSGKIYKANVKLETTKDRDYCALRCPIPSGAEILDSTLLTTGSVEEQVVSSSWRNRITNKNTLDNEVQFFFDEFDTGSVTLDFTFRAVRRGIYPTPPVQAECMYESEIFGRSDGYLFIIK